MQTLIPMNIHHFTLTYINGTSSSSRTCTGCSIGLYLATSLSRVIPGCDMMNSISPSSIICNIGRFTVPSGVFHGRHSSLTRWYVLQGETWRTNCQIQRISTRRAPGGSSPLSSSDQVNFKLHINRQVTNTVVPLI